MTHVVVSSCAVLCCHTLCFISFCCCTMLCFPTMLHCYTELSQLKTRLFNHRVFERFVFRGVGRIVSGT